LLRQKTQNTGLTDAILCAGQTAARKIWPQAARSKADVLKSFTHYSPKQIIYMTLDHMRQQGGLYVDFGKTFSGEARPNINIT
jgi:hypothetical protein